MGMYDSVLVECPNCSNEVEFQSKAGKCELEKLSLSTAPKVILGDLDGEARKCKKCKIKIQINVLMMVDAYWIKYE